MGKWRVEDNKLEFIRRYLLYLPKGEDLYISFPLDIEKILKITYEIVSCDFVPNTKIS